MNFIGFALTRSSLVCKKDWCPVISALCLVDPKEAVSFYRFSSELTFQAVGGTGKWRSALLKVESGPN